MNDRGGVNLFAAAWPCDRVTEATFDFTYVKFLPSSTCVRVLPDAAAPSKEQEQRRAAEAAHDALRRQDVRLTTDDVPDRVSNRQQPEEKAS